MVGSWVIYIMFCVNWKKVFFWVEKVGKKKAVSVCVLSKRYF